jgi:hypothetical protein
MSAGVGLHLVFHLNWIACVTKRMLKVPALSFSTRRKQESGCDVLS